MLNIENQKKKFENHKATFTDYGNVKILDFKNPESNNYRIRFLFEEDYCRLHISGDLGELVATNLYNMTFEKFLRDFTNNAGYFEEKINCHSRALYRYDEEKARQDIINHFDGVENLTHDILQNDDCHDYDFDFESDDELNDEIIDTFLSPVFDYFDTDRGISCEGIEVLSRLNSYETSDLYEAEFGKERTGIIELYLMAFKLAIEKLNIPMEVTSND